MEPPYGQKMKMITSQYLLPPLVPRNHGARGTTFVFPSQTACRRGTRTERKDASRRGKKSVETLLRDKQSREEKGCKAIGVIRHPIYGKIPKMATKPPTRWGKKQKQESSTCFNLKRPTGPCRREPYDLTKVYPLVFFLGQFVVIYIMGLSRPIFMWYQ